MKSANADEIFGFASDEIKSVLISRRSRISSRSDFIVKDDFTHPQGWI